MNASTKRVMYYGASASPIGGFITHPFDHMLQSDSSVTLGQAGGHAMARVDSFAVDELMRSGTAYSQTTGSVDKATGNWTTLVTSVVENLNVLEVVTADRIVSRIALEHDCAEGKYYPKVTFVGTQFENLRINGQSVDPVLNLDLVSGPQPGKASRSGEEGAMLSADATSPRIDFPDVPWTEEEGFVRRAVAQSTDILESKHGVVPEWLKRRYEWMQDPAARARKGYLACSLVTSVRGAGVDPAYGHVIAVPGFGNVFLGELLVDQASFKLTMLRIEMGCLATGNVSFGTTHGNGIPMP